MTLKVSIVGGSGYVGGELLRLLLRHPHVEINQVTSESHAGKYVTGQHPNLRGVTRIKFTSLQELTPCDLLFLALPHGSAAKHIDEFSAMADKIIDLSADFRLGSSDIYQSWYGKPHPAPHWLDKFTYGLPELHRQELPNANYVSGVGCNATVVNLALFPLAQNQLIDQAVIEVKVGSSEGGKKHTEATHHPERSGSLRSFAPTGHRHQAEIIQELGQFDLYFSATAVEMVRGILCTAHVFLNEELEEQEIWRLYRGQYEQEPFIRFVNQRRGIYRYPEPKLLVGTNWCDIGFAKDPNSSRLVVISAIDNLMKGAAGSAVQCMNIMMGYPEETGLAFIGLHPI